MSGDAGELRHGKRGQGIQEGPSRYWLAQTEAWRAVWRAPHAAAPQLAHVIAAAAAAAARHLGERTARTGSYVVAHRAVAACTRRAKAAITPLVRHGVDAGGDLGGARLVRAIQVVGRCIWPASRDGGDECQVRASELLKHTQCEHPL